MNIVEELKRIEQMFRDKTPPAEIHARVARFREIAEADDKARKQALTEEMRRVLHFVDSANDYVYAKTVAESLKMDLPKTEWLLGKLVQSEYIYETANVPSRYMIEQKGRDAVHDPSSS